MSNLNTILNKLGKIEEIHETNLGKHEVNLASIDDIQNKYSELNKKHIGKTNSLISEAKNELKLFIIEMEGLSKEGVDIAKKAKDLGINVESIPNYNDVMKRIARDKNQAMEDLKPLAKYR